MSQSTVELPGAQGPPALIPRGRNGRRFRFPIGFVFAEDPKRRFGQMPGHGPDGLRVALPPGPARDTEGAHAFLRSPIVFATDRGARPAERGLATPDAHEAGRPQPRLHRSEENT